MQIAVEFLVDAPIETAFAAVADVESWAQSIVAIESMAFLTPGPVSVGARFRETRTMFGRRSSEEMTVAEIVSPRRLVLTAFNHGTAYRVEHRFTEEAAGTRMTLVFEARPATPLAWLFAPLGWLFMGGMRRQLKADCADLKREAERRHRHGTSNTLSRA